VVDALNHLGQAALERPQLFPAALWDSSLWGSPSNFKEGLSLVAHLVLASHAVKSRPDSETSGVGAVQWPTRDGRHLPRSAVFVSAGPQYADQVARCICELEQARPRLEEAACEEGDQDARHETEVTADTSKTTVAGVEGDKSSVHSVRRNNQPVEPVLRSIRHDSSNPNEVAASVVKLKYLPICRFYSRWRRCCRGYRSKHIIWESFTATGDVAAQDVGEGGAPERRLLLRVGSSTSTSGPRQSVRRWPIRLLSWCQPKVRGGAPASGMAAGLGGLKSTFVCRS
jgi:hypothetical protein